MKIYEVVTNELGATVISAELQDGGVMWIPTDPNNSDYAEYLRYTTWVEAGNNPDEFWTKDI